MLAEDCRSRRRALGLTQRQAAEIAGVSERFVRAVESGREGVQLTKLQQLLDALGLELRAGAKADAASGGSAPGPR